MGKLFARIPMSFWILMLASTLLSPSVGFGVFFILFAVYLFFTSSKILGIVFVVLLVLFWDSFQQLEGAMGTLLVIAFVIWVFAKVFSSDKSSDR